MSRWKINEDARKVLEEQYLRKRFPSPTSKKRLAEELDVAPRRIQVWFQNRRQREKVVDDEPQHAPRSGHAAGSNVPGLHSSMDDNEFDTFDEPWSGFYQPGMAAQGHPRPTPDGTSSLLGAAMNNFVYALDPGSSPVVQSQLFDEASCGRPGDVGPASTFGEMGQMPPVSFLSSSDDIFQALMGFEEEHQKAKLAGLMSGIRRSAANPAPQHVDAGFGSKADLASLDAHGFSGKRKMPPDAAELGQNSVRPARPQQPADADAAGAAGGGGGSDGSSSLAAADAAAAPSWLGAAPALPPGSECTTNEILKQLNSIHQQCAMCASAPSVGSSSSGGGGGSSGGDGAAPQAMRLASIAPGMAGGCGPGPMPGLTPGHLPQPPQPPPALHPPPSAMVAGPSHQGPGEFDGVGDESRRMLQARYQQMHRGEFDSWVTAADAVNSVLDSARKQYALAVNQPQHHGAPVQSNIPPVSAFPAAASSTPHSGMAPQHQQPPGSSLAQLMPPQQQQALQQLLRGNLPYPQPHPSLAQ